MDTPLLEVSGLRKSYLKRSGAAERPVPAGGRIGSCALRWQWRREIHIPQHCHGHTAPRCRVDPPPGAEVQFDGPAAALANGIAIVEQELSPVPAMTVAENIYLGREPTGFLGRIDYRQLNSRTQTLLDGFGFSISATDLMMDLTVAQTQLVEIAKALSYDAEIIIFDEPTSALGEAEAEQLFAAIALLKARGKGIVYVSHRLSEIFSIADSYTVFRDGQFVQDGALADINKEQLIQLIVGRP